MDCAAGWTFSTDHVHVEITSGDIIITLSDTTLDGFAIEGGWNDQVKLRRDAVTSGFTWKYGYATHLGPINAPTKYYTKSVADQTPENDRANGPADDTMHNSKSHQGHNMYSCPKVQAAYNFIKFNKFPPHIKLSRQRSNYAYKTKKRFKIDQHGQLLRAWRVGTRTTSARKMRIADNPWAICVPSNDINRIMLQHHKYHDGRDRMLHDIQRHYYIPNLTREHNKFRASCATCNEWKSARPRRVTRPIYTTYPLEHVTMDLTKSRYPTTNGWDTIFVIIDHFTKFTWATALSSKECGPISVYLERLFRIEGKPTVFHTDNGKEFIGDAVRSAIERMGSGHVKGMPRRPQVQGLVENKNKVIKRKLYQLIRHQFPGIQVGQMCDWEPLLESVLMNENDQIVKMYKYSPFFLYRGRLRTQPESASRNHEAMATIYKDCIDAQHRQGEYMKQQNKTQVKPGDFQVGDKVSVLWNQFQPCHCPPMRTWSPYCCC